MSDVKDTRTGPRRPLAATEAEEIYGIRRWGAGYFGVGPDGSLRVRPEKTEDLFVDLPRVVDDLRARGLGTPVVLRFPQMIETQVRLLHEAFDHALERFGYAGRYRGVFPIKVCQMEPFLSELVQCGGERRYGLEAGTKPELALALGSSLPVGSLIVANGYKDAAYVELALAGMRIGYEVVLVVEKFHELDLILKTAQRLGVRPWLGLRLRVHTRGTGKWARSGGSASKFGLNTGELLEAVEECRRQGMEDRLALLHFHIGSQITDVRRIKQGVTEGACFYAALRKLGVNIRYLDVGGGLGVDYDGSRSASDCSVNYSVQEYANDVVYWVQTVCEEAEVRVPDLVTESGRAVSAYHALTLFTVEQRHTLSQRVPAAELPEQPERCVVELFATRDEIGQENFAECYHDALQSLEQLHMLFRLGKLSLAERAAGETAAAQVFRDVVYYAKLSGRRLPEEIQELEQDIATKYVCNFSIFQSVPDSWAIGHLFPVCPIQRLDERPDVWATIADITCDSDGKIDKFGDVREEQEAIRLHELDGRPYHLGAFLLGAYQDVMGNFHNLLGETNEASILVTGPGSYELRRTASGDSCAEIVEQFGHDAEELGNRFATRLAATDATDDERTRVLAAFDAVLRGSPYLT